MSRICRRAFGAICAVVRGWPFEAESLRERDRYCGLGWHERSSDADRDYRNGFYERDYVTRFGTIRLRIARTRGKNFLPAGLRRFQRRAEEVALLIREAFLRGKKVCTAVLSDSRRTLLAV